jgi:hypothetical protein
LYIDEGGSEIDFVST